MVPRDMPCVYDKDDWATPYTWCGTVVGVGLYSTHILIYVVNKGILSGFYQDINTISSVDQLCGLKLYLLAYIPI